MPDAPKDKKRPTLSQVVFRIDFATGLQGFSDALPAPLLKAAKTHFPLQEPKKPGLVITAALNPQTAAVAPTVAQSVIWQFFGKSREKLLSVAPDHIDISIRDYISYEAFRAECADIVGGLSQAVTQVTINRMGLRYINLLGGPGDPLDWTEDIEAPFRVNTTIAESKEEVLRAWNTFVMMRDELRLTCLYGIRNPDFPAPVAKRQFILDFDAQLHGQSEAKEVIPFLDKAHAEIKKLYEASVTASRRAKVNGV